ncbi:hypothetical protein LEMLEM_LOCUS8947 [Lemmus lemmus]
MAIQCWALLLHPTPRRPKLVPSCSQWLSTGSLAAVYKTPPHPESVNSSLTMPESHPTFPALNAVALAGDTRAAGLKTDAPPYRSTLLANPFAPGIQPSLFPSEAYEPVTKPGPPSKGGSAVGLKGYVAPAPS